MNYITSSSKPWICAQIGAREHYAIPRVLAAQDKLERLLTDYWWPLPKLQLTRAVGRWHPQLSQARVIELNVCGLFHRHFSSLGNGQDWDRIQAHNAWFQRAHLKKLMREREYLESLPRGVFFAYSYAARSLLEFFRDLGWKILLGQIDPGPADAVLIAREVDRCSQYQSRWNPPPDSYWENLYAEQELADLIIVNSNWSRRLCMRSGTSKDKIRILPLAYENDAQASAQSLQPKHYPERFDQERPLRVLFLGTISLRKGIYALLESIQELTGEPIEFWLVGIQDIRMPEKLARHPQITWVGPVSRTQVAHYYAQADVFILPTLSDGFAITQLEAQAWRLPVIATRHCGEVVRDGINGLIIESVNARQISRCLRRCLHETGLLERMSQASQVTEEFSLQTLGQRLMALETS